MAYKFKIYGQGDQDFYNLKDAVELLGISMKTARKRIKLGKIPIRKVGGALLIPACFVDRTRRQGWSA